MKSNTERIAGSYRDPSGEVYRQEGRIFRTVNPCAREQFAFLRKKELIRQSVDRGFLIETREITPGEWPDSLSHASHVLEHGVIPYISYPYEWSFGQLRAAALLHLDFQLFLLERDAILTDATAYNIQFLGGKPVFIDLLSIAPYREGQYWLAHRQFCEQFLNPLLLRAIKGIPHNAWYRGQLEGISSLHLHALLSLKDKFSWNVFSQVVLQARLEKKALENPRAAHARIQSSRGLPRMAYKGFLLQLRGWISNLAPKGTGNTVWEDYAQNNTYNTAEAAEKRRIVREFAAKWTPGMLLDLGCNTGDYSLAALEGGARYAVGFDFDFNAVEMAHARAIDGKLPFFPLWLDASNPSPGQGWAGQERDSFQERAKGANALIALAFEHHLAIGKNIPLDQVVSWLVHLAPRGLIEFTPKKDPTVQMMLSLREDIFPDYTVENFAAALEKIAHIVARNTVSESGREMFEFERS